VSMDILTRASIK